MSKNSELTEQQRYWLAHIEACEESDLSIQAYADKHGLKASSLYNARYRLKAMGGWRGAETAQPQAQPTNVPSEPKARFKRVVVRPATEEESPAFSAQVSAQGVAPCRIHLPNGVMLEVMTATDTVALAAVVTAAGAWP